MASSTEAAATTLVTDEQLIADLSGVLASVEAELAEIEPRREQLTARAEHLRATIAVYKGEQPSAPRRKYTRRSASKPRSSSVS